MTPDDSADPTSIPAGAPGAPDADAALSATGASGAAQTATAGADFGWSATGATRAGAAPIALHIVRLDPDVALPAFARAGDAGLDLTARESAVLSAGGGRCLMPTGLAIDIPAGHAGFVLPRSGMAARHGLSIVNAPGLIDSGYRGEVIVALLNTDPDEPIAITRGDRIAQLVILAVPAIAVREVDRLSESPGGPAARGTGGYGHSGR